MKKILAVFILFFAFSINANAQYDASLKDVASVKEIIKLTPESEQKLQSVFYDKHKFLMISNLSEEAKEEKFMDTEKRIKEILEPALYLKLKENQELFKAIIR